MNLWLVWSSEPRPALCLREYEGSTDIVLTAVLPRLTPTYPSSYTPGPLGACPLHSSRGHYQDSVPLLTLFSLSIVPFFLLGLDNLYLTIKAQCKSLSGESILQPSFLWGSFATDPTTALLHYFLSHNSLPWPWRHLSCNPCWSSATVSSLKRCVQRCFPVFVGVLQRNRISTMYI